MKNESRINKILNKTAEELYSSEGQVSGPPTGPGGAGYDICNCPMSNCTNGGTETGPNPPPDNWDNTFCHQQHVAMVNKCSQCKDDGDEARCRDIANKFLDTCKSAANSCSTVRSLCNDGNPSTEPKVGHICNCKRKKCKANDIRAEVLGSGGCFTLERYREYERRLLKNYREDYDDCEKSLSACRKKKPAYDQVIENF